MTFLTNWEDFEKAAERLYLQDPMKVSDVQIIYHASTPVFFMRLFKDVFNLYERRIQVSKTSLRLLIFTNNLFRLS